MELILYLDYVNLGTDVRQASLQRALSVVEHLRIEASATGVVDGGPRIAKIRKQNLKEG